VRQGKALYVGISNYKPPEAEKALGILKRLGTPCLIHQPNYSMMSRWIEDGLLDLLEREGVGCIAFSPLAGGRLTDRYLDGIPEDSRAGGSSVFLRADQITPELVAKVRKLNGIAAARGQKLAQMALAWVLRDPRVTSALIGASKVSQVEECVAALDAPPFSPEELAAIDAAVKS
jgi:L-glyceraldehyde 3-phosphate reductase